MPHIGYVIKRHREARGMIQAELATCAKIRSEQLSRIENGHNIPRGITLQSIAKCLKMDVEALLGEAAGHINVSGGISNEITGKIQTVTIDGFTVRVKNGELIVGKAS